MALISKQTFLKVIANHKKNMKAITDKLEGRREDIWQDEFICDMAEAIQDILLYIEQEERKR